MHRVPRPGSSAERSLDALLNLLSPEFKNFVGRNSMSYIRGQDDKRELGAQGLHFTDRVSSRNGRSLYALAVTLLAPAWGLLSEQIVADLITALIPDQSVCLRSMRSRGAGPAHTKDCLKGTVRFFPHQAIAFVLACSQSKNLFEKMVFLFREHRPDLLDLAREDRLRGKTFMQCLTYLHELQLQWINRAGPGRPLRILSIAMSLHDWKVATRLFAKGDSDKASQGEIALITGRTPSSISISRKNRDWIWTELGQEIDVHALFQFLDETVVIRSFSQ